ncbi:protogenin [Plakobranchus ocellatus]|uniref:Protogenin n=1 Tax=Plakobranchus ocellatus TaxID=259542 RepID=A0AAV4CIX7_9GAST|nr:protogenin [Plakobranchus ocellatus]
MASELLYLVFLFTIALRSSNAQDDHAATKIKAGLVLVPEPSRIYAYPSDPLLLGCSVEVNDPSLLPLKFTWLKNGRAIESRRARVLQNGSLFLEPHKKVNRQRLHNGIYQCIVVTSLGDRAITRQVEVVFALQSIQDTVPDVSDRRLYPTLFHHGQAFLLCVGKTPIIDYCPSSCPLAVKRQGSVGMLAHQEG